MTWNQLINAISNFFSSKKPVPAPVEEKPIEKPVEIPVEVKPEPIPEPVKVEVPEPVQLPLPVEIDYKKDFTKIALDISQSFEGQDPYANITGNFDGAGLTCGALGWTIKWGNQQRLVKEFVKLHGEKRAKELMPTTWGEYWSITNDKEASALMRSGSWSKGSATVKQPYRSELQKFWKSPEMTAIQIQYAWKDMGEFAMKKTIEGQKYFNLKEPKLGHFCYWFDQAVMNGQGNSIPFEKSLVVTTEQVLNWCGTEGGAGQADTRKNVKVWQNRLKTADKDEIALWKMAYLRSLKARDEYDVTTMNRRGTLALGEGFVNGTLRSLDWMKD